MENTSKSTPIFIVRYLLNDKSLESKSLTGSLEPFFSPGLEIENEPNLFGLINSLLEDMVEMGSYIERVADNYPPYNVSTYLSKN